MFFTRKYLSAINKLGMVRGIIDEYDEKSIRKSGRTLSMGGLSPIESAVRVFGSIMGAKVEIKPNKYKDVALSANSQIVEWVRTGKLDPDVAEEAIVKVGGVFPSDLK